MPGDPRLTDRAFERTRASIETLALWLATKITRPDTVSDEAGALRVQFLALVSNHAGEGRVAKATLGRALTRLRWAGPGFQELISSGLTTVVMAHRRRSRNVLLGAKGYISDFKGPELTNETFLALRLIWCAMQCRAYEAANRSRSSSIDWPAVAVEAIALQKEFASQQSNGGEWLEYLARYSPGRPG